MKLVISETVLPLKLYFPVCVFTGPSLGEMIQHAGSHCTGGVATETSEANVNMMSYTCFVGIKRRKNK